VHGQNDANDDTDIRTKNLEFLQFRRPLFAYRLSNR
jgi:hypothetical protein